MPEFMNDATDIDVLFVLKIWGIALLMNAIGWPVAMWLGGYWKKP